MARQQSSPKGMSRNDQTKSNGSLNDFHFTFSCASNPSSKGSFIEPDPGLSIFTWSGDSSESLSESVQAFPEEFGRTYHAFRAGSYAFPNDVNERERLDLQNEIITTLFGGRLYFSPLGEIRPPMRILDIATGTGDWAIHMGDLFPQAEVVGTDLSPIQPPEVPPNVNFYVEDSSEPWDYSDKFDFIHTRITGGCWSDFQTQIAQQAFSFLNPGGWLESHEMDAIHSCDDGTLPPNGAIMGWSRDMTAAGRLLDRPVDFSKDLRRIYEDVGFVDVRERQFKIPTNAWPKDERLKDLGKVWERNFQLGLTGFSCASYNRAFGRSAEETEVSLVEVRRELSDTRIHAYMTLHAVWGRKPSTG